MINVQERAWGRGIAWMAPFVRRFGKFAVVGGTGTVIHLGLFWLLMTHAHLHYLLAGAIGIEAGLLSNYMLNNNWTFADRRSRVIHPRGLARYHVVALGGMLINLGVLQLLVGVFSVRPFLANLVGMPLATGWNYTLSLWWTWQEVNG